MPAQNKPLLKNFYIVELAEEHIDMCIAIADEQLGKGYFTRPTISQALTNKCSYHCLVALINDEVIGFSFNLTVSVEQLAKMLKLEIANLPACFSKVNRVGVLKTASVNTKYQGHGIGHALVKKSCEIFINKVQVVTLIAWKKTEKIHVQNMLELNNFTKSIEMENFWAEDSKQRHFNCPYCGDICHCSAVLFVNILQSH